MAQRRRRRQYQQALIFKQCPKKDCGERIVEKVQVEVELSLFKWFGFWNFFGSEHQKITLQENCHNFWPRRAFSKSIAVSESWDKSLQDCTKTLVPAATGEIVSQVEKRLLQKIGTPDFWAVWVLSTKSGGYRLSSWWRITSERLRWVLCWPQTLKGGIPGQILVLKGNLKRTSQ